VVELGEKVGLEVEVLIEAAELATEPVVEVELVEVGPDSGQEIEIVVELEALKTCFLASHFEARLVTEIEESDGF